MSSVRILADDLTGALDTAAKFVKIAGKVAVSWSNPPDELGATAFDTETRALPPERAGARVAAAAAWLCGAEISYKKLDSQLRGPVAAEIAAAFRGGRFAHAIIAPAFPAQGRCTRNGRQWARDPGTANWRLVGPDLAAQLENLNLEVTRRPASGARATPEPEGLTLWDAQTDADLDAIVTGGADSRGPVLWCGSAGLAGALARHHAGPPKTTGVTALPAPLLFVVGTARPAMLRQIEAFGSRQPDCWIRAGENTKNTRLKLKARLPRPDPILLTFDLKDGLSEHQAGDIITQRMRDLLENLPRPGSLFVSGGETLHRVLDILDARGICIDGEFEDGIPTGHLIGGRFDGTRLISKSGAFGSPDILVRIAEAASEW